MKSENTTTSHTSVYNATEKKWVGGKRTYALPIHLSFYPWFSIRRSTPSGAGGHHREKARSLARHGLPAFSREIINRALWRERRSGQCCSARKHHPRRRRTRTSRVADTHRPFCHAMMQYRAAEIASDEHEPKSNCFKVDA